MKIHLPNKVCKYCYGEQKIGFFNKMNKWKVIPCICVRPPETKIKSMSDLIGAVSTKQKEEIKQLNDKRLRGGRIE